MPCPSCSSPALDPSGHCPSCGWSDRPQGPQPQNLAAHPQPQAPQFQQYPGYPPPSLPQYPPPSPGYYPLAYPVPTAPSGLAQAVQVLLGASGLVALVGFATNTYAFVTAWSSMVHGTAGQDTQASGAFVISTLVLAISWLLMLPTGVCFIIWLYRGATLSAVLAPGEQRLRRGWAIGGWFVPIAFLVLPRLVIGDVWRASRPLEEVHRRKGGTLLVSWWWPIFCFQQLGFSAAMVAVQNAIDSNAARSYIVGAFFGVQIVVVARVVAAVLGIVTVRRLTVRQQIRILQGPGQGHPYSLAGIPQPGYAGLPPYLPQYQALPPTPQDAPPEAVQDAPS